MQPLKVTGPIGLLDFLLTELKDRKKLKIKQLLKHGSVRVNGQIVTRHSHALRTGDTVDFLSRESAFAERLKAELDFPVIFEDESILVVEKPAGLLTMGTEDEKEDTLYFILTQYVRAKSRDGRGRIFIVHRLDRDASGLVVFAKNEKSKVVLQENWNQAVKKYYALVEGVPRKKQGTIESFLIEDKFRRVYSTSERTRDAKHSITHFHVLQDNGDYALLDIGLETGRKNQIRVQLSDEGHPIVGDEKYGARTNPLYRLALHSYKLSFPHPVTGELLTFNSDLPFEFKRLVGLYK